MGLIRPCSWSQTAGEPTRTLVVIDGTHGTVGHRPASNQRLGAVPSGPGDNWGPFSPPGSRGGEKETVDHQPGAALGGHPGPRKPLKWVLLPGGNHKIELSTAPRSLHTGSRASKPSRRLHQALLRASGAGSWENKTAPSWAVCLQVNDFTPLHHHFLVSDLI
ncbi:hypothetical protein H1C71_018557 [Ictidomys tridecemlineatus]|nr:hypothetical protein H1C71_018557 [Ictidomys tridecemlineatus]